MFKRFLPAPSPTSVGSNQTAVFDMPVDRRYHRIAIRASETATTSFTTLVTEIRVKINGVVQRVYRTADSVYSRPEIYFGRTSSDGSLVDLYSGVINTIQVGNQANMFSIWFAEPWLTSPAGQDIRAWGMADVASFQIEVDLATIGAGFVLEAFQEVDNKIEPIGVIRKRYRTNVGVTNTGNIYVNTLPKRDPYACITALSSDISEMELTVDQAIQFKGSPDAINERLSTIGLLADSGAPRFQFDADRRVSAVLPMLKADQSKVNELSLRFNMAAANSFPLVYETVGLPD